MRVVVARGGDVDEQPADGVDPARVDDVVPVRLLAVDVVRVDLEQVVAAVGDAGRAVVEDGHVVVRGQVVHRGLGDLHVGVGVPGEDLLGDGGLAFWWCLLWGGCRGRGGRCDGRWERLERGMGSGSRSEDWMMDDGKRGVVLRTACLSIPPPS